MSHFARTHGSPIACANSNTFRHAPALQAAALNNLLCNRDFTCGLEKDNPVSNTVLLSGGPEMMSPALPPLNAEPAHHVRCRPDTIPAIHVPSISAPVWILDAHGFVFLAGWPQACLCEATQVCDTCARRYKL